MTQFILRDAPADLVEALSHVADGTDRVIIECNGKRIAAVSLDLLEWIEEMEDQSDRQELERARQEPSDPVPYEIFRRELGL